MIVRVTGPCGGGKSTVVRRIHQVTPSESVYVEGRRMPCGYLGENLFILGHYERETMGGGDSFRTLDAMYDLIWHYADKGCSVLFEGKSQNGDNHRMVELGKMHQVAVILLETSSSHAIAAIRARATANRIRDSIVTRTWFKVHEDARVLEKAGIAIHRATRDSAFNKVRELLS